ncbi:hypothetical protein [Cupriavidus necator]|uniref:hypothetical protein n=1 Tax=Cupriavidus necator TaxID=106590 RepID=UPI00339D7593
MKLGLLDRLAGSLLALARPVAPSRADRDLERAAASVSGFFWRFYCIAQSGAILEELTVIDHCGRMGCRFRDFASMGGKQRMVKPWRSKTA